MTLAAMACGPLATAQADEPNYGMPPGNAAFPQPTGFDSFQLTAPYSTANPFGLPDLQSIANGFELFTSESFDGNGRTCSSCHLPERNYNLSLEDFQSLSHEDQQLVLGGLNPHLENAEAVTEAALFNIDQGAGPGTEGTALEPRGPFRSSMAIGGIGFSTLNNHVCKDGEASPSPNGAVCTIGPGGPPLRNGAVDDGIRDIMLGWSGEGSLAEPFPWWDGSSHQFADCDGIIELFATDNHTLRDLDLALATFALAAVKTHFPITQNRQPDVDFRCPTAAELLDMAAFQKWLGRRFELDITQMKFHDKDAQLGRNLFSTREATCVACHVNAGASDTQGRQKTTPVPFLTMDGKPDDEYVDGHEPLFLIGTNKTSRNGSQSLEAQLVTQFTTFAFPFDPGDHQLRGATVPPFNQRQAGFNVQSIIEAVRNRQFFHNNGVTGSIEDAIAFYFTPAFHCPRIRYTAEFEVNGVEVEVDGPEIAECAGARHSQGGAAIGGDFRAEHRVVAVEYEGNIYDVEVEWEFSPSEILEALGGSEGIGRMGLFLRALSAYYALADCERFVDEMADRAALGLPTALPADHCRFALGDVQRMLTEVPVPPSYTHILSNVALAEQRLEKASGARNAKSMAGQLGALQNLLAATRRSIASTPELH